MSWQTAAAIVGGFFTGLGLLMLVLSTRDGAKITRLYRTKVGLDLAGLVALLPEHLRQKRFTGFKLAPSDGERLSVGLVYDEGTEFKRVGNPPNVGMDFNPETGALVAVHPAGIGLGLK